MRLEIACFFAIGALLCGCAGAKDWDKRYGPDPALPKAEVEKSVVHQQDIIVALAGLTDCAPGEARSGCGYQMTVAGFNFVDEQCDAYLRELFIIDKERDRARNFLGAADKLTNAVLAVSPASKATMAIVAQAFGLTSDYVDAATDSYLYKANSGSVLHVVAEMQKAYRDQTFSNREKLASQPDVYAQIRGYLRLCMPPTIESKIEEAIASTTAAPSPQRSGPGTIQDTSLVVREVR